MKTLDKYNVYELRENELRQFNGGISLREVYGALGALDRNNLPLAPIYSI